MLHTKEGQGQAFFPRRFEQEWRITNGYFDRSRLAGGYVSTEQPSVIDNSNIKNGFYGASAVCVIFGGKNFLYNIPDTDTARCFVILGYCDGDYPKVQPRKENRFLIID